MACPQLREEGERMLAVMLTSRSTDSSRTIRGQGREEEWEADDANEGGGVEMHSARTWAREAKMAHLASHQRELGGSTC